MQDSLLYHPWLANTAAWSAPATFLLLSVYGLVRTLRKSQGIALPQRESDALWQTENRVLQAIAITETRVKSPRHAFALTLSRTILAMGLSLSAVFLEARSFPFLTFEPAAIGLEGVYLALLLLQTIRLDSVIRRQASINRARISLLLSFTCTVSALSICGRERSSAWCILCIALLDAFSPNYRNLHSSSYKLVEEMEEKREDCVRPVALGFDNPSFVEEALSLSANSFVWQHAFRIFDEKEHPALPSEFSSARAALSWRLDTPPSFAKTTLRRIFWHHRSKFLCQQICAWINVFSSLLAPLYIQAILSLLQQRTKSNLRKTEGVLLSLALWLGIITATASHLSAFTFGRRISNLLGASLLCEVFAKSMRRSAYDEQRVGGDSDDTEGIQKKTDVQVVLSSDVYNIADMKDLHIIFPSAPASLILTSLLMYKVIGKAVFGSWLALAISVPVKFLTLRKAYVWSQRQRDWSDRRMALSKEIILNIRAIKFASHQAVFAQRLAEYRENEIRCFSMKRRWQILEWVILWSTPVFSAATTFGVHSLLLGKTLDPVVAFTTISLLRALTKPLDSLAQTVNRSMNAFVSALRLESFLKEPETAKYDALSSSADTLQLQNATCRWGADGFALTHMNVLFPSKAVSLIYGNVGSGKSSLLLSLLGEMPVVSGRIFAPCPVTRTTEDSESRIAYCAQVPFLMSDTIKENILFGLPMDLERYAAVVHACALRPDLKVLPSGDETLVGERGLLLSGGQKARISLARALYSDADCLLLDDVFSAVDYNTAHHLLRYAIKGAIAKDRTILVVSHYVSLLASECDFAVHVSDGKIISSGSPQELGLLSFIDQVSTSVDEQDVAGSKEAEQPELQKDSLYRPEVTIKGFSAMSLYALWARATGALWKPFLCYGILYPMCQLVTIGSTMSVRLWSGDVLHWSDQDYITLFLSCAGLSIIGEAVRLIWGLSLGLDAANTIYDHLIASIMGARIRFFDSVPIGRLLARLSQDSHMICDNLPYRFASMSTNFWTSSLLVVAVSVMEPSFLVLAGSTAAVMIVYTLVYTRAAQEMRRAYSAAKSPLSSSIVELSAGLTTLRAFGVLDQVLRRSCYYIDEHLRPTYNFEASFQWFQAIMEMLGATCTAFVCVYAVLRSSTTAAGAGFAITCALELTVKIFWTTANIGGIQIAMTAVERVAEYHLVMQEPVDGLKPPSDWPRKESSIEVKNLSLRYAPHLPMVVKNLSFSIGPGQKVGIVGRTGAGKSSLGLAFFRFLEAQEGAICIGGIDVSTLELAAMRAKLNMIPQEPSLFVGTIRFNLDPAGEYTDSQIWDALKAVNMAHDSGTSRLTSLEDEVQVGAQNFSSGEKQLMIVARSLLRLQKSNFVFLDEASSAFDAESDKIVQTTIRRDMKHATILCIAHRIETVIDYDMILVLDAGELVEYDTPANLLEKQDSAFAALCRDSGNYEALLASAGQTFADR